MVDMYASKEELLSGNVWLWGKSIIGKVAERYIMQIGSTIKGYIDISLEKQKESTEIIKVYKPEDFYKEYKEMDLVVCCCSAYDNISRELKNRNILNVKKIDLEVFREEEIIFGDFFEEGIEDNDIGRVCRETEFRKPEIKNIISKLPNEHPNMNCRKMWEFAYIINMLEKHNMLIEGKKGLGFAVGEEPLPSYFASKHVEVMATDLGIESDVAKEWAKTNQNSGGDINCLFKEGICTKEEFDTYVSYRDVDMNHIPDDIGEYDFCWSSCAIEHVGSLELSKEFLKKSLSVLKPGGVAVHTTEINLLSNDDTIIEGMSVIYRRKDLEEIQQWCQNNGYEMPLSFKRGNLSAGDMFVDFPPYTFDKNPYHICLFVDSYVTTSYGIIIKKSI